MPISDPIQIERYYQALLEKDSNYVGIFYVGVKTTHIFCISTCRARKPKPENVVFHNTAKEALLNGFRPCKICRPTENTQSPPEDVVRLMQMVADNPSGKIRDIEIRKLGYRPEKIRRWFKKNHGLTFQAYQRMMRINSAYQQLMKGNKVTEAAFDSGYDSLSGFGYSFKNIVGVAPDKADEKNIINITRFQSPLGPMFACATEKGICLLEFTDRRMLETEFKDLCKRLNAVILKGENEHLKLLKEQLKEYFDGSRTQFELPLDTPGTEFQQKAWEMLHEIPYGETSTYKNQALRVGKPKAVRAVASANGHNRVAIVIPCHRVIGSDGKLTGYAGGLPRKKWLLDHERNNLD